MSAKVIRLKPFEYVHIANNNSNTTEMKVGPATVTTQDHETIVEGPSKMLLVPPRQYCVIADPVVKNKDGEAVRDKSGQFKLRHGETEVRMNKHYAQPFPLYPGERISQQPKLLTVVGANQALRLKAVRDFEDKIAGDEWLFEGPATYIPRVEVTPVQKVLSIIIKANQAQRLKAKRDLVDRNGVERTAGEEWLVHQQGAYLPGVYEEVVGSPISGRVLTEKTALHLRAVRTFTDVYGKKRKAGEEWLITINQSECHTVDVFEEMVDVKNLYTLSNRQYCVICDPHDEAGVAQLGTKKLVKGETKFFLKPGEHFDPARPGVQDIYILAAEEALLLRCTEKFVTADNATHEPGDRWMVEGPCDYIPPVQVEVLEKRTAIPLDKNEGVYVRNVQDGKVSMVAGKAYMLRPNEELWSKKLPNTVEEILLKESGITRDKTRAVTFRLQHNCACQVYDFKTKKSRVLKGPELVMLQPEEQFTVLTLSGSTPKKPGVVKTLFLRLGPDFMTDVVTVETSDHARLKLQLSYNWHFDVTDENRAEIFSVPDFVGDACKAVASRVRGHVASQPFDTFHKNSAKLIRRAVFGMDGESVKDEFRFPSNHLVLTNIDIQSVSPVDPRTQDMLAKSVQLAIEITTSSQEATAKHKAEKEEQEAKGILERQKISDEAAAENTRKELMRLQAVSALTETEGQAKAEAVARSEASRIEGESSVTLAKYKAAASKTEGDMSLQTVKAQQEAELEYKKNIDNLEIHKAQELSKIESGKFNRQIASIGSDTIASIAQAGPELQAKMLEGLGLTGFLVTDGNSPINLFNTANGMLGNQLPGNP